MTAFRLEVIAFILAAFLIPASATAEESGGDAILAAQGKQLFATYCVSCHGENGDGGGPVAQALLVKPADLRLIAKRRGGNVTWGEIVKFVDGRTEVAAHGRGAMPVWGKRFNAEIAEPSVREEITRGDLAAIISFLKTIQSK